MYGKKDWGFVCLLKTFTYNSSFTSNYLENNRYFIKTRKIFSLTDGVLELLCYDLNGIIALNPV